MTKFINSKYSDLIYRFIDLYLFFIDSRDTFRSETIASSTLASGAPYEKEISDDIILLSKEISRFGNHFKLKAKEKYVPSEKEVSELLNMI